MSVPEEINFKSVSSSQSAVECQGNGGDDGVCEVNSESKNITIEAEVLGGRRDGVRCAKNILKKVKVFRVNFSIFRY